MPKAAPANIEEQVETEITAQEPSASSTPATPATKPKETPAPVTPPPVTDDPEVELEGGKKVKMSELKKGYMLQSDYTTKTQALAEQRKEIEEMQNIVTYLKANPAKLQRIIAILDEKEEALEQKKEEITDELAGLDPNDPIAKALRAQKEQISTLLGKLDSIQRGQEQAQKETLVQQAQQALNKTLDEAAKNYTFISDKVKATWRKMTLSHLKDNPKKYVDEQDFINTINEIGKLYYDELNEMINAGKAEYVKSKTGIVPATPPVPGSPMKAKPSMDNLQEILEEELGKEEAATKK